MQELYDVKVVTSSGPETVKCFGRFQRKIDGKLFTFLVTDNTDDIGQGVVEERTRSRVCRVAVGQRYLTAFGKAGGIIEQAKVALDEVIER